MDDDKRKYNDFNNVNEPEEEITYKYMSMDTSSYLNNESSQYSGKGKNPKGKSKAALILIILIIVLSVIYVGYYFIKGSNNNDNNVEVQDDGEIKAEDLEHYNEKEEEITDSSLIEILDKKIETLDVTVDDRRTILFDKTRRINNFDELDLMIIAVNNVQRTDVVNGSEYCYNTKTQTLDYKPSNCEYSMIVSYVKAEDLDEFYKSMYGKSLNRKDKFDVCPIMLYDKGKDIYYLSYACGGAGYPTNLKYIYKYTESDKAVFVYVAYGVMAGDGNIYTDYNMKKLYKEEDYDFDIDKYNYKEFSKYKFVFEKDDDDLHFVYIQKLEQ